MNKQTLNIFNAAVIIVILAVAFLAWFYMRDQFMWGIILIIVLLLIAGFVNVVGKIPWQGMGFFDVAVAVAAVLTLGFAWFYMRDQFMWAVMIVLLLLFLAGYVKLVKWLRDVVSIQVVVHKRENEEGNNNK